MWHSQETDLLDGSAGKWCWQSTLSVIILIPSVLSLLCGVACCNVLQIRASSMMHCAFITAWSEGDASPFNYKQRHEVNITAGRSFCTHCCSVLRGSGWLVGMTVEHWTYALFIWWSWLDELSTSQHRLHGTLRSKQVVALTSGWVAVK